MGDADDGIVLFLSGAGRRKALTFFSHANPVLHIRHFNNRNMLRVHFIGFFS
ncbi:hypothetical protein O9X99_08550 [Agrobacterium salinitolerans]|uniref:hypothetical protein n=1 Tax=Agrobacterium TaxID=357 RepID=UPI001376484A|nr:MULTISPECIES: hypothetical protein [Agrobacterium]MCZ7891720.1 hypothetical protein [Agrobacterium salinitolerans]